jgi:hypothetical protein
MNILLWLLGFAALVALGLLFWRMCEIKPLLPSLEGGRVLFGTTPYADILCGLAFEVKGKEGPYVFLRNEAAAGETSLLTVFYKTSNGQVRQFQASEFPLVPNERFDVYQCYRHFMDGGPAVLQLVAVPATTQPMSNREIRQRREKRSLELLREGARRFSAQT